MNEPTVWRIVKLDPRGRVVYQWSARLLLHHGPFWLFEAHLVLPASPVFVAGLRLNRGDRVLEAYFQDRWYNIFEVYDGPRGPLKGWYANLARPAQPLPEHRLQFVDLYLDLVVHPKGDLLEVDREEFEALALPEAERRRALQDWEMLKRAFRLGQVHLARGMVPPLGPPAEITNGGG